MTVQKSNPAVFSERFIHGALKVGREERCVSMDRPLTFPRQQNVFDQSSCSSLAKTWIPQGEANIFLSVSPDEVSIQRFGQGLWDCNTVFHCVSNKRRMCLMTSATVLSVLAQ
jgi:hypothetical protein